MPFILGLSYRLRLEIKDYINERMNNRNSYWISSGKYTLLERIILLISGLLIFFFLIRVLKPSDYGAWMLFVSLTALADTARHGFLRNPLIRYLNLADPEEKSRLMASSFLLNLLFSIVSGLLFMLLGGFLARIWDVPGLEALLYLYFPIGLFLALFHHYEYVLKANFNFKGPFIGYLLKSGIMLFAVTYFFITKEELTIFNLGIIFLIAVASGTFISYFFTRRYFTNTFNVSLLWTGKLFSYGKYTLGTNIGAVLLRNVDIWMIGWFINPVAVAIYNIAIRVANLFEVPTMALANILFPKAVEKIKAEGEEAVKRMYEKSVALILIFSIPCVIGILMFSEHLIWLIAGEQYLESAEILEITVLYGLLIPFSKQMGILLDAVGKAKKNMMFVFRDASINVVMNLTFIPLLGVKGAALATLTTYLIVFFINQIYLNKNYKVQIFNVFFYFREYILKGMKKVRYQLSLMMSLNVK